MIVTRPTDDINIPPDIMKSGDLEWEMDPVFRVFEKGHQKNANIINDFFNQPYFLWKESLIDKLYENNPNITFDDIKDEWINLALLYNNSDRMRDLKNCFRDINHSWLKNAFKIKLFNKIQTEIWTWAPYDEFARECPIPGRYVSFTSYFQKIVTYLDWKEKEPNWKKVSEILEKITITNDDINSILLWWEKIPSWIGLKDASVPESTRKAFDRLLSFEIWKEANRAISIAKNIKNNFEWLLTNTFPAINTIVWENDEYKYDENKLWDEYKSKLKEIKDDTTLSEFEKNEKIRDLRREYYIQYLKKQNEKIWRTLEELYNKNFDYSKIDPLILKDYLSKVADIRLKMLFDNWINEALNINFWNLDSFEHFYKNLADPTIPRITLTDVLKPWIPPVAWNISIPIEKKIIEWENHRLKDITQFWKNVKESFDALPIEFSIAKSDIENNDNISFEDKIKLSHLLAKFYQWDSDKYVINWENVWILIYLFFIINSRTPITTMDPQKQKEVENVFWQAKNRKIDPNENYEKKEYLNPSDFKNRIESVYHGKFENWSEIWIPIANSELPWWWYWWMKMKLDNIDMRKWTFTGTPYGWELKFDRKFEWKPIKFDMNDEFFNDLNWISKDTDKIRLLPNPDKLNFNSYKNGLKGKLWNSDFVFPPEWEKWKDVKWEDNKFIKTTDNKEVEVKYFWVDWDDKATYKIEYNQNKHSFTVSSTLNQSEKWKDWKKEIKRLSYKRDMDWNNFLIFFNQKKLHPQTEEESNKAIEEQNKQFVNSKKRRINWYSFNNVKNWLKDIFWAINKKIKEYDAERTEDFKNSVEMDILNLIWSSRFLPPSIKYAVWHRQEDLYNEGSKKAWDKIEKYLKALQADEEFADAFDQLPPHSKLLWWNKSYKQYLEDLRKKSEHKDLSDDELHRAAALLLANIEKWWSAFRWLTEYENQWFWIKILLGKWHHEQFLIDKQKCINHLKRAWKEKSQIQDILAKCEMEYLINNITWANWKLPYFNNHGQRWLDWEKNYIPYCAKLKLSSQFADKLKDCRDKRFTQSSIKDEFEQKISHNSFDQAREDFYSKLKSSRYSSAIGNLRKMIALTKNETQRAEMQKCFMIYMLSGVLDVYGRKDLREDAEERSKTIWFLPWMLAKNTNLAEDVATLLKDFDPSFTTKVESYFRSWDLKNWKMNIGNLINEVNNRWWKTWTEMVTNMNKFEKYTREFRNRQFTKNSTLDILQKSLLEWSMENINKSILSNSYIANSWWLLSNANVARDRMEITSNGTFAWTNNEEIWDRQDFWNNITEEINKTPVDRDNINNAKLLLKQYFERFQIYEKERIYQWIRTAYERKAAIWHRYEYQTKDGEHINMGSITDKEINSIIRYAFQWTVMSDHFSGRRLPKELKNALKAFQKKFKECFNNGILDDPTIISEVFGIWNKENIKPLALWSWDEYNRTVTLRQNSNDDDKDLKKKQKDAFLSWNFINYDIAIMEKRLKNLDDNDYEPVTTSVRDNLEESLRIAD